MDHDNAPVIIKKKNNHGGHHGGAWKVAYADFVTAMMALFIVLWVLSQKPEVIQSVAKYFQDPIAFSDKNRNVFDGKNSSLIEFNKKMDEEQFKEMEKEKLKEMGEKILKELSESPEFMNLIDQIEIQIVEEGLRIEMIEAKDDIFFEIGTALLKRQARLFLEKIGSQLSKIQNHVVIEGHTDARPYSGDGSGYTNYELSADRANSARRVLTSSGISDSRVDEIRGYADKLLRDKSDPFNVVNRRISIIVKYTGK